MRYLALVPLLLIVVLDSQSSGADPESNELKYAPAIQELRKYDLALQALKKKQEQFLRLANAKHRTELAELREQTAEALKKIQDDVTKEGKLDDALAIRQTITKLNEPTPEKPKETPEKTILDRVDGTKWVLNTGKNLYFKGNTCYVKSVDGPAERMVVPYGDSHAVGFWSNKEAALLWYFVGDRIQMLTFSLSMKEVGVKK